MKGKEVQETLRKKCIECDAPVTDGAFDLCQKCEDAFHAAEEQSTKPPALPPERAALVDLEFATAQLRHAYMQLVNGYVTNTYEFATGLIAPQIVRLENVAAAIRGETGSK